MEVGLDLRDTSRAHSLNLPLKICHTPQSLHDVVFPTFIEPRAPLIPRNQSNTAPPRDLATINGSANIYSPLSSSFLPCPNSAEKKKVKNKRENDKWKRKALTRRFYKINITSIIIECHVALLNTDRPP